MNSKIYLSILFFFLIFSAASQNLYEELSKQLCDCIDDTPSLEELNICSERLIIKNYDPILKHFDVNSFDEVNMDEFTSGLIAKLGKNCEKAQALLNEGNQIYIDEKTYKESLNCEDLKDGEFYYFASEYAKEANDTTFVTIKNKNYMERMKGGKTYSNLTINWKSNCEFELKFVNSNDPFKRELSGKGDVYSYKILATYPEYVVLKLLNKESYGMQMKLYKNDL